MRSLNSCKCHDCCRGNPVVKPYKERILRALMHIPQGVTRPTQDRRHIEGETYNCRLNAKSPQPVRLSERYAIRQISVKGSLTYQVA
jgi:hypothetical protein